MDEKWMDRDEVERAISIEKENLILCLQESLLKEAARANSHRREFCPSSSTPPQSEAQPFQGAFDKSDC